jgi:hypothetical protein
VPLLDANSGFEPRTFDEEVYARWRVINRGPWRFAYDDQAERADVRARHADAARRAGEAQARLRADRQRAVRRVHGAHREVIDARAASRTCSRT